MDLKNWNVDKTKMAAQQEELKKNMSFSYIGHGPRATGFMAKEFKRTPGLYARCVQCGYYMPLDARGEESCICGNMRRDERTFKFELPATEIEIFKGVKK